MPNLGVAACDNRSSARAQDLAARFDLPVCTLRQPAARFLLIVSNDRVALKDTHSHLGEIMADWESTDVLRRIRGGRKQHLARAAGLHKHIDSLVLDACAGLGRDGVVLAALGARVIMTERQPAVFLLLEDAMQRAQANQSLQPALQAIALHCMRAETWLERCQQSGKPDVVYLDPMYPGRGKSALPSKNLQVLRSLMEEDDGAEARLLQVSLRHARRRVVVKRPAKAPCLEREPDFSYSGGQARYDVYLTAPESGFQT